MIIYLSVQNLYLGKGWEKGAEDSGVRETVGKEERSGFNRRDKMGEALVIREKKELKLTSPLSVIHESIVILIRIL